MRLVTFEKLVDLQKSPDKIRNICILAHVDHGKTTLADSLVASNGIISQRLAGKLRYMDSRKDEQERGITMKSSSIALYHHRDPDDFLVNLIDSPGHVDFSTEVTTAVRLCDGAVVVVDVVEGVCAQTIVALRHAWEEDIKPILVLNKLDRIILELKFTPLDAYIHLTQILERVNAVMAELLVTDIGKGFNIPSRKSRSRGTSTSTSISEDTIITEHNIKDWSTGLDDVDDSQLYFAPEHGNVVFACALDGWGFRISDFAKIFSKKLGFNETVLNATLWGNYYINTKLKRIMKGAQEKAKKPLFVQLVLENIWAMYEAVAVRKDKEMVLKIVNNLNLQIHPRELKPTDPKLVLYAIMIKWLPLSTALLDTICEKLPSPLELTDKKVERLMFSHARKFAALPKRSQELKEFFLNCNSSDDAPVIIFVSKMVAVESKSLPENRPKILSYEEIAARREQAKQRLAEKNAKQLEERSESNGDTSPNYCLTSENKDDNDNNVVNETISEDADVFIAFARVYSGTVKKGCKLYILGPRYDPVDGGTKFKDAEVDPKHTLKDLPLGQHVTVSEIKSLYQLMGRELEMLQEVPAGNICDLNLISVPILRVAIEPVRTSDMARLVNGMKLLNQADPCVQTLVQESGEHVLVTAGEVHLQRCIDDLRERFAKVEVTVSKPIVPFRETIIDPPKMDMVNELVENHPSSGGHDAKKYSQEHESELIVQATSNKKCTIKLRAKPLPNRVTELLENSINLITVLKESENTKIDILSESILKDIVDLKENLRGEFQKEGWDEETVNQIWSFGPKRCGPNLLINKVPGYNCRGVWPRTTTSENSNQYSATLDAFYSNFVNGFQLATLAGPLCEEPMSGVAFIVEDWLMDSEATDDSMNHPFGPFSGQLMSCVRDACRKSFQTQAQRLKVAMYSCSIQVNGEVLGKLYAVLGKRCGRILHGDLQEGSANFEVTALLPVIESFDFANEVRQQTSGLALPQLVFCGWEVLEIDPFWQPTTEEEYLHFGEKADTENRARKYMNAVRKRKGLRVEEKTVEFAEKQRTLTRNK
ncbi:elongation factor-like GTPase 1 isoform X2 [Folsomia candida]|uniref:elongation factor-like GTPase 1 isoform X2 n=1 Tax=Folsomia candida TaxID=158441 RepID=UPI001604E6E7|nr:elongation factor-like GTPase 1 isoform X2 [Folsomia candida]